jgi:hypothetical protein
VTDIIQLEEVIDGIWPLFGGKAGTGKHSTDGIGKGLMGTFDLAVLVRGVGCSRLKGIASILKELNNSLAGTQITTWIHANILVGDILGETMIMEQPTIQEVKWWRLGGKALTI